MIAVAGSAYDTAAEAWAAGNRRAVDVADDLAAGLAGCAGMGGDDASSADFVAHYDDGARETVAALDDLATAFATITGLVDTSADHHLGADARAVLGAPEWVGRGVGDRGVVVAAHPPPPSALGADTGAATPALWDTVVDHLQGLAWPSADVGRLRDAAALWRRTGDRVRDLAASLLVGEAALAEQRSPEVPLALAAGAELRGHCATLADTCTDLAEACAEHAEEVEVVRQIVRDLLEGLAIDLGVAAAASAAGSLVTFGAAAAAYVAAAAARTVVCAKRIVAVLRTLTSIRAVSVAAGTYPKARGVSGALEKFRNVEHVIAAAPGARTRSWALPRRLATNREGRQANMTEHFERHSRQFPTLRNVDEYDVAMRRFLADPPRGTETIVRQDGSVVRWHERSQWFAIMDKNGAPQTLYKLDRAEPGANRAYFLEQLER